MSVTVKLLNEGFMKKYMVEEKKLTEAPFIDNKWEEPLNRNSIYPESLDLLTLEEANKLPKNVLGYQYKWWVQPNYDNESRYANIISNNGTIDLTPYEVSQSDVAVRPVLTVSNLDDSNLKLYRHYPLFSLSWIYIGNNQFLFNGTAQKSRFDSKSNEYKSSEIKGYLDDWLKWLRSKDANTVNYLESLNMMEEKKLTKAPNKSLTEAKLSDFLPEDKIDTIMKNTGFGNFNHYKLLDDMQIETVKINEDPNDVIIRHWKVIKNDDGNFEAYELGNGQIKPFVIYKPENESLKKKIRECLSTLNEAEMSDEDKADSKVLWDIYNKTQNRKNAKLTPEENAVLDKYGLVRNSDWQTISKKGGKYSYGPEVTNRDITRKFSWNNPDFRRSYKSSTDVQSKINLADRARKMDVRGAGGYEHSLNYDNNWDFTDDGDWKHDPEHLDYIDPKTGEVAGLKSTKNKSKYDDYTDYYNTIAGKERAKLNHEMTKNVQNMKQSLWDRKYYQRELDNNDAEYDSYKAKIQQEYDDATARYNQRLASNEEQRRYSAENARAGLDNTNAEINKLLKRKDESLKESYVVVRYWDNEGYPKNKIVNGSSSKDVEKKVSKLVDKYDVYAIDIASKDVANSEYFKNAGLKVHRIDLLGTKFDKQDKWVDESMNRKLPEGFNEKNLKKCGTCEYDSNAGRHHRIDMYRKFANLTEGEEITADNINEWALDETSCRSNTPVDRVRAELLGERYTGYEID